MADDLVFDPLASSTQRAPIRPMQRLDIKQAGEGAFGGGSDATGPAASPSSRDVNYGRTLRVASYEDFSNATGSTVPGIGSEQMANARYIAMAGQAMGLSPRDITIGIMTALGESSLRVINHGDVAGPDSRGLFQQRANGAWGSLSDRMDPRISATNFFRALTQVGGREGMTPTGVAHRVQRNRDANHYAKYWDRANSIYAALTSGGGGGRFGGGGGGQGGGNGIVSEAMKWIGTPYKWGGTGPLGFDCSGFTQYVYRQMGIHIPRVSYQQANGGTTVARTEMRVGDLVSWDNSSRNNGADHIGIYIGNGRFIAAPAPGQRVKISQLYGNYRVTRYGGGR